MIPPGKAREWARFGDRVIKANVKAMVRRGLHPDNLIQAVVDQAAYYGKTVPMIFVFGSNESGFHGAGAALHAVRNQGAVMKVGFGRQGNSFAIPTKDWRVETLPIDAIKAYVDRFIVYARMNPGDLFQVTAIGTGLGGIAHKDMAELFKYAPANCLFDTVWQEFLPKKNFWGTF